MAVELYKEKWSNKINTLEIGATKNDGGTRSNKVFVGGESALPFLFLEGEIHNKPLIALEVWDVEPEDWPEHLKKEFGPSLKDPIDVINKVCAKSKIDLISLRLQGCHPDSGDKTPDQAAKFVRKILDNTKLPLIITGCGDDQKDNIVMPVVSNAAKGEKCLIGNAVSDNYKTLAASCLADGHNIIAESPIDINIAKQLNILISDMGLPLERIAINPTIGSLGYGLEYSYSIMERARLAALSGDKTLACPFICFIGQEVWRAKEAKAAAAEFPAWGNEEFRGPAWEMVTTVALLQAGADILVMRSPKAIDEINKYIEKLFNNS